MILGDLLQQCYNIADTLIVGRYLGENALAAVGSAFSLMTFLTSVILGLAMGSGTVFSIRYGQKDMVRLKEGILAAFERGFWPRLFFWAQLRRCLMCWYLPDLTELSGSCARPRN